MSTELKLDAPGTLVKPGPIGRFVRLVSGVFVTYAFADMLLNGILALDGSRGLVTTVTPTYWVFWLVLTVFFLVTPYVINIGFSRNWGRKSQLAILAIAAVLVAYSYLTDGTVWSPALGWFVYIWITYVSGHLGISFLLAALLATPGCEMRAIPHLYMLVTGRETKEHYCPGHLDKLDKWEAKLKSRRDAKRHGSDNIGTI